MYNSTILNRMAQMDRFTLNLHNIEVDNSENTNPLNLLKIVLSNPEVYTLVGHNNGAVSVII